MKKESSEIFSRKLSKLIKQRGLSMSQIAARVGMNKTTLYNYCNGVMPRHLESLIKLADFFEVSLDQLLNEKESDSLNEDSFLEGEYVISIRPLKRDHDPS